MPHPTVAAKAAPNASNVLATLRAWTIGRLLNLALRSQFAQLLRTLNRVQRGEFEVVGGSPKPQAPRPRGTLLIETYPDRDILIADGVEVAGCVRVAKNEFHMRRGKNCFHLLQSHLAIVLDRNRERMTVKDGHMDQL